MLTYDFALNTVKMKVLLVDDRKENLLALEALLQYKNVEILKANSGREALELLLIHDFALALVDVQMPEINGFDLAEYMRGSEKSKNVPIIFVTAGAIDQKHTFRGYEAGAVDFIYKPLDPRIVKSKVLVFLELHRQKQLLTLQLAEMESTKDQLKIAKETAEAANRSKSAFLTNMSHEIRTPLGAILGFTELLNDPLLTNSQKEYYLNIITKNGHVLSRLIDDILDLAKVESGKLEAEMTILSLPELLNDVVSLLEVRAQEKRLTLEVKYKNLIPENIESDPLRLRQILLNIIGNAIKFTNHGSVQVTVDCHPIENSNNHRISFEVKDTGIGISKDRREVLFQPFTQADNSTTRKFGGTGLGLSLSRRLAHLLHGDVRLSSEVPEVGSIFIIDIETKHVDFSKEVFSKMSTQSSDQKANFSLKDTKVLVVEDSPDNQMLVNIFLSKAGSKVEFADNGKDGIHKALNNDYDIVFMDIQMPVMGGHEATKELRKLGYNKPIIALSAHAMTKERDKSFEVGCNGHLVKPIDRKKLLEAVVQFSNL